MTKLTDTQKQEIKTMLSDGKRMTDIAKKHGVSRKTVWRLLWAPIGKDGRPNGVPKK